MKLPNKTHEALQLMATYPLCVIDVGASGGLSAPFASEPYIQPILFEPDARATADLGGGADREARVLHSALANKKGPIRFHLTRDQECSSCLEPNMDFLSRFPNPARFETLETIEVNAETLDQQIDGADPDFIKLDVQGFEAEIIEGGSRSFERSIGAIIEVEFEPLYRDQKLFPDVHRMMAAAGFELFDLQRSFWKRSINAQLSRGQCLFANALYLKSPETAVKLYGNDLGKLIRAARIYHMFGYGDVLSVLSLLLKDTQPSAASFAMQLAKSSARDRVTRVTFLRKKIHGLLFRIERCCSTMRKRVLLPEHFAKCDREIGNTPF